MTQSCGFGFERVSFWNCLCYNCAQVAQKCAQVAPCLLKICLRNCKKYKNIVPFQIRVLVPQNVDNLICVSSFFKIQNETLRRGVFLYSTNVGPGILGRSWKCSSSYRWIYKFVGVPIYGSYFAMFIPIRLTSGLHPEVLDGSWYVLLYPLPIMSH